MNETGNPRFADLAELIGEDNAFQLCEQFGGTNLYIPSTRAARRPLRDRRISRDARNGSSIPVLCRRYHLSERQLRRILRSENNA